MFFLDLFKLQSLKFLLKYVPWTYPGNFLTLDLVIWNVYFNDADNSYSSKFTFQFWAMKFYEFTHIDNHLSNLTFSLVFVY